MTLLTVNAGLLALRMRDLIRGRSRVLDTPRLDRLFDALAVITGVIMLMVLVSHDGSEWQWDWSVILFTALIVVNVVMSIACTTLMNRRLDQRRDQH